MLTIIHHLELSAVVISQMFIRFKKQQNLFFIIQFTVSKHSKKICTLSALFECLWLLTSVILFYVSLKKLKIFCNCKIYCVTVGNEKNTFDVKGIFGIISFGILYVTVSKTIKIVQRLLFRLKNNFFLTTFWIIDCCW